MSSFLCRGNAASNAVAALLTTAASSAASASTPSSLLRPPRQRKAPFRSEALLHSFRSRTFRAAATTSSSSERSTGGAEPTFRVSGELRSSAPPQLVWEVLTDYDGAASIFDNVTESRILGPLEDHRRTTVASGGISSRSSTSTPLPPLPPSHESDPLLSFLSTPFEPSAIEQHCSWKFLVFGGSFRMLLGVEEGSSGGDVGGSAGDAATATTTATTKGERSIVFSLLEPGFVREFEGIWSVSLVEEEDGGEEGGGEDEWDVWSSDSYESDSGSATAPTRKTKTRTIVRHSLGVTPAVPPPSPVRPVVRKLFQKQVAGLLEDLEAELERRRARAAAKS